VAGVFAAGALLASVAAGTTLTEQRSLARSVDQLAPSSRTVRAAWFGVAAQSEPYSRLDSTARAAVRNLTPREPTATVLIRESSIGGAFVALGAVDGLARWIRLTSGRLPRECEPVRCEVVQLRGGGRVPRGIVVVGRGRLRTTALFGDAVPADRNELERAQLAPALQRSTRYHQPAPPPLLLGADVRSLISRPDLSTSYRSYGWVVPLRGGDVRPWTAERFAVAAVRERAALQQRSVGFDLGAPTEELIAARERARVGARRLLLLGGQGAALLIAFAAFAATRMRRSVSASDHRLVLLGVPSWQRVAATVAHAASIVLTGVVAAWFAAFVVLASIGERTLATHALLGSSGVTAAFVLAALAIAAVVVAFGVRTVRLTGRLVALDAVAAALLALVLVAVARGATNADELLRERGTGTLLLLLPAAIAAVAAIVCARILPAAARGAARLLPDSAVAARFAALSLARRPGAGAVAASFLVVSVGLAIFAWTYGVTLERGQRDQASFALGADLVLREDLSRLVPVRRVATPERLLELGSDVAAAPVIRASANVAGLTSGTGITVLGLDRPLLATLRGGVHGLPDLRVPAELHGPRLPERATALSLEARATNPGLALEAIVRERGGEFTRLQFAATGRTTVALPPSARGGTLIGFRLIPPPRLQERGADAGRAASGALELGPLRAGRAIVVADYSVWTGTGGVSRRGRRLVYTLTPQLEGRFGPRQPIAGRALPAVVSPTLAALAGARSRLPLGVNGQPLTIKVAATAPRFPSTRGDFVVVDGGALSVALDVAEPGSGVPTEAWINAMSAEAELRTRERLRHAPFDVLRLDSRVERERALRDEPIARGALAMLAIAAAAALALALLAVALAAIAELRDEQAELVDLESQGALPSLLRRIVAFRQLTTGVLGLTVGVLTGILLATLAVSLVTVSASGEPPVPPLELALDVRAVAVALGVAVTLAAVSVAITTARAFRAPEAGRPQEVE
jgi:hypothetical protein